MTIWKIYYDELNFTYINIKFYRVFRCGAMQYTLLADLEFSLQSLFNHVFDAVPQLRNIYLAYYLRCEGV